MHRVPRRATEKPRIPIPVRRRLGRGSAAALIVAVLVALMPTPASAADSVTAILIRTVQLSQLDPPSPDSSGIAYDPNRGRLLIADSEVEEMSIFKGVNLWETDLLGNLTATGSVTAYSREPTGLSFDPATGRMFVSDDSADRIFIVLPGGDGRYGTGDDVVSSFSTRTYGSFDPEDVAFNTRTGDLFTADGEGDRVYRVSPGQNGVFEGAPPNGDDVVASFDVGALGVQNAEGLGYHHDRDTLLVVDNKGKKIYETTTSGTLLTIIDISGPSPKHAEDVAVAPPSGGGAGRHLYVVDRGVDNGKDRNENDGKMYEFAIDPPPVGNQAPLVNAGADQSITFPDAANLSGSVSDDGLPDPPGTVTTLWTAQSGPGTVTFGNASSPTTTATFSAEGTYVLRLTANDSQLSSFDQLTVTTGTTPPPGPAPVDAARATTSLKTAATGHTVGLPGGIQPGDLLLVWFRVAGTSGGGSQIGWPAGWTEMFEDTSDASDDASALAWRKADGTEGSTIAVATAASAKAVAISWRITGAADPATQPPQRALAIGSGTTPNPPSLTPSGGSRDYLWLAIYGSDGETALPPTFPANYATSQASEGSGSADSTTTNVRMAGASRQLNAASEDPGTYTVSGSRSWTAVTIAIPPS